MPKVTVDTSKESIIRTTLLQHNNNQNVVVIVRTTNPIHKTFSGVHIGKDYFGDSFFDLSLSDFKLFKGAIMIEQ